jgi:hypothetical protein
MSANRIWSDHYSFTGLSPLSDKYAYVTVSEDGRDPTADPNTQILSWSRGTWKSLCRTRWQTADIATAASGDRRTLALSAEGDAMVLGTDTKQESHVTGPGENGPQELGFLKRVISINNTFFAVGMHKQCYRFDDQWSVLNEGMDLTAAGVGIEAIDGSSVDDLYAVGWGGHIWHFDGTRWRPQPRLVEFMLHDVCCAGDGRVYACGRMGLLIALTSVGWRQLRQNTLKETILRLAWFQDQLFALTKTAVYVVESRISSSGEEAHWLRRSDPPKWVESYSDLKSSGDSLWALGRKDILAFDGTNWKRID